MKIFFAVGAIGLMLSGCVAAPSISSNIIEADSIKGNLINITGDYCGLLCEGMALQKAQEVCPSGYIIHNTVIPPHRRNISMIIRCKNNK